MRYFLIPFLFALLSGCIPETDELPENSAEELVNIWQEADLNLRCLINTETYDASSHCHVGVFYGSYDGGSKTFYCPNGGDVLVEHYGGLGVGANYTFNDCGYPIEEYNQKLILNGPCVLTMEAGPEFNLSCEYELELIDMSSGETLVDITIYEHRNMSETEVRSGDDSYLNIKCGQGSACDNQWEKFETIGIAYSEITSTNELMYSYAGNNLDL